ncbi:putative phosphoric monoester hydrolase [Helianthus anomalus]
MESENLMDSLEVCLDFIDESRKTGLVLVHCFAGVSRSATIVTAYLMSTERISLEGLTISLTMFEDMGFKVDHSSTLYRHFRLKVLGVFSCPIYAIY